MEFGEPPNYIFAWNLSMPPNSPLTLRFTCLILSPQEQRRIRDSGPGSAEAGQQSRASLLRPAAVDTTIAQRDF